LTSTSSAADQFEDMKETVKMTEQKFEEKVKELTKVQCELEVLKTKLAD